MFAGMAQGLAVVAAAGNSTGSCTGSPYPWTYTYLGECTMDTKQFIGMLLGLSSIGCWLIAQFPQLLKNYRNGTAESLSIWFLADWLSGDLTNLAGCILLKQVPTQLYTAIYFVFIDSAMVIQWVYYNSASKKSKTGAATTAYALLSLFAVSCIALPYGSGTPSNDLTAVPHHSAGARVLLTYTPEGTREILGYVLGWISGIMYLTSRLPQIIKNFRRGSCEGLSIMMFVMAVLGNLTYALGVLLQSVEVDFIEGHLPWLVGSAGTLMFDFTIGCQYLCYGTEKPEADEERQPLNGHRKGYDSVHDPSINVT